MDIPVTPDGKTESATHPRRRQTNARRTLMAALAATLMFSSVACDRDAGSGSEEAAAESQQEDAIPVRTVEVVSSDITRSITATTTLSPKTSVRMVAELSGTIRTWTAETGDAVESGQLVATIEVPELDVQIREARLNLARITREVGSIEPLRDDGYLSQQAWEDALSQRDAARAALDRLQEQSGRQQVRSPLDGVVLERAIERGEAVSAGALLYQIANLDHLVADISVPERELAEIELGMVANLEIPAAGGDAVRGSITRVAPTVDQATGTVLVRIDVEDGSAARLRPGMFTTVEIAAETRAGVATLPARAVIEEGDRRSVFVVRGAEGSARTVERIDVTLGLRQGERQEITSGLTVGDEVVLVGQSRLREGASVRVANDGGS